MHHPHIAYAHLTRTLTNMHHTERTALDSRPDILDLVTGEPVGDAKAIVAVLALRTERGDAWRQKQGIPFVTTLAEGRPFQVIDKR